MLVKAAHLPVGCSCCFFRSFFTCPGDREGRGAENNEVSVIYQIRVAASGSIFILLPISFRLPCGNLEIKCTKEEHAFICRCHTKTFL